MDWSLHLAETLSSLDDSQRLPQAFLASIASLLPSAYCYVAVHPMKLLAEYPPTATRPLESLLHYITRFVDPHVSPAEGCFALHNGLPRSFAESVFHRTFYIDAGYVDEINHVSSVAGGETMIVGVLRSHDQGRFSDDEIAVHEAIHPLVAFFARKLHQIRDSDGWLEELSLDSHVVGALDQFGESLLTAREHDVIKLALLGNDTQSTADRLGISRETVKLHRKHAYAKLRVSSQGELFYEFLEAIRSDAKNGKT